jgi:hypothetical protein
MLPCSCDIQAKFRRPSSNGPFPISAKQKRAIFALLPRNYSALQNNCLINPLTPNDLQRRRAVSPLKIRIASKNMLEKPTNSTIIHSVY